MSDAASGEEATLFPKTAGERLREAREAQGLSLTEIASRTRIPIRQLEAIESGDYASLPSITYAVGFAKAYARAVGLDEAAIGKDVRGQSEFAPQRVEYQPYEMADPARTPSRGLTFGALIVAVILIIGVGLYYGTSLFRGSEEAAPAAAPNPADTMPQAAPAAAPAPAPVQGGQVTLIATDQLWLRVYDGTGKTLFEKTMNAGDRYDVPADANNPMINVGRPDKLQVTVNGSNVPPLGDGKKAIKDVPINAQALLARGNPAAAPTPSPSASPTAALPPAFAKPTPRPKPHHTPAADQAAPAGQPVVTPAEPQLPGATNAAANP